MQALALVSRGQRIAQALASTKPEGGTSDVAHLYSEIGWRNAGEVSEGKPGVDPAEGVTRKTGGAVGGVSFGEATGICFIVATPTRTPVILTDNSLRLDIPASTSAAL